ncbi:fatty acid desaturase [Bacteriovoracaceae bacterium]|nr:fatty acid desaturase [Bacteriovoracaceae bacterium]
MKIGNKEYNLKTLDLFNTGFIVAFHIFGIIALYMHFATEQTHWLLWVSAIALYFLTGMGVTAGYHRLFSHRAYKTNSFMEFLYLVFGAGAFENSCLKWSADHRVHHNHVDTEKDPYNIKEGFFFAHIGWIFLKTNKEPHYPKDLTSDKLVMWQHKYYLIIASLVGIIIPWYLGALAGYFWGGLGVLALGRLLFVYHSTFFINSLCHMVGTQPFSDEHTARDSVVMAFFSYGEGFHNFHHQFQTDYRNGIRWYYYDPTKWLIMFLHKIGVAKDLKQTPQIDILRAKMIMASKKNKVASTLPQATSIAQSFDEVAKKWKTLKSEYNRLSQDLVQMKDDKLEQFDHQYIQRKAELLKALEHSQNECERLFYKWSQQISMAQIPA